MLNNSIETLMRYQQVCNKKEIKQTILYSIFLFVNRKTQTMTVKRLVLPKMDLYTGTEFLGVKAPLGIAMVSQSVGWRVGDPKKV